jgi:hypothetical protein
MKKTRKGREVEEEEDGSDYRRTLWKSEDTGIRKRRH